MHHDVNLNVLKGQVVVIIGSSGAGKSTLLRCINKLEDIDSGEIAIDGEKSQRKQVRKMHAKVGMVFQKFNLFPHLTVYENIALGPIYTLKKTKHEVEKIVDTLLEKVGLMKKRVVIFQVVSNNELQLPVHWRCNQRRCCLMNLHQLLTQS